MVEENANFFSKCIRINKLCKTNMGGGHYSAVFGDKKIDSHGNGEITFFTGLSLYYFFICPSCSQWKCKKNMDGIQIDWNLKELSS